MEGKRFEAVPNDRNAWDIIDYVESEKINGFVIYNDLGDIYFSSAPQLVDLLNDFYEEILKLEKENEKLKTDIRLHIEDSEKYRKLSLQFDNHNKELISENGLLEKEIEQLKHRLAISEKANFVTALEKENENLKHRIKKLQNELNNCEEDYILEEYL